MPTYERLPRFDRDFATMTEAERKAFQVAARKFVADLERGRGFRPGLRVKGIQSAEGIFEMTWAKDGRATFEYGEPIHKGEPHIVWRRVGTHKIFETP